MSYSYFSTVDGSHIRTTSDKIIYPDTPNEVRVLGDYSDIYYYANGAVLERPQMPLTGLIGSVPIVSIGELYILKNQILRIENIPDGATLEFDDELNEFYGGPQQIDDGFFEFVSAKPGLRNFKLSSPPFLQVNIDAYIESL